MVSSQMSLFLGAAVGTSVVGGIALAVYLYVSDGPVLVVDESLVGDDE